MTAPSSSNGPPGNSGTHRLNANPVGTGSTGFRLRTTRGAPTGPAAALPIVVTGANIASNHQMPASNLVWFPPYPSENAQNICFMPQNFTQPSLTPPQGQQGPSPSPLSMGQFPAVGHQFGPNAVMGQPPTFPMFPMPHMQAFGNESSPNRVPNVFPTPPPSVMPSPGPSHQMPTPGYQYPSFYPALFPGVMTPYGPMMSLGGLEGGGINLAMPAPWGTPLQSIIPLQTPTPQATMAPRECLRERPQVLIRELGSSTGREINLKRAKKPRTRRVFDKVPDEPAESVDFRPATAANKILALPRPTPSPRKVGKGGRPRQKYSIECFMRSEPPKPSPLPKRESFGPNSAALPSPPDQKDGGKIGPDPSKPETVNGASKKPVLNECATDPADQKGSEKISVQSLPDTPPVISLTKAKLNVPQSIKPSPETKPVAQSTTEVPKHQQASHDPQPVSLEPLTQPSKATQNQPPQSKTSDDQFRGGLQPPDVYMRNLREQEREFELAHLNGHQPEVTPPSPDLDEGIAQLQGSNTASPPDAQLEKSQSRISDRESEHELTPESNLRILRKRGWHTVSQTGTLFKPLKWRRDDESRQVLPSPESGTQELRTVRSRSASIESLPQSSPETKRSQQAPNSPDSETQVSDTQEKILPRVQPISPKQSRVQEVSTSSPKARKGRQTRQTSASPRNNAKIRGGRLWKTTEEPEKASQKPVKTIQKLKKARIVVDEVKQRRRKGRAEFDNNSEPRQVNKRAPTASGPSKTATKVTPKTARTALLTKSTKKTVNTDKLLNGATKGPKVSQKLGQLAKKADVESTPKKTVKPGEKLVEITQRTKKASETANNANNNLKKRRYEQETYEHPEVSLNPENYAELHMTSQQLLQSRDDDNVPQQGDPFEGAIPIKAQFEYKSKVDNGPASLVYQLIDNYARIGLRKRPTNNIVIPTWAQRSKSYHDIPVPSLYYHIESSLHEATPRTIEQGHIESP